MSVAAWGYKAAVLAQPLVRAIRPLVGRERLGLPRPAEMARLFLGRRPPQRTAVPFAVCAIYLNEGPYLKQWIDFHRLMGVERFFLYDNGSTDDHREVLAPYEREGVVVRHPWPGTGVQAAAFGDCIRRHRADARWIAFLDLDEFLFALDGTALPEAFAHLSVYPGVALAWVVYGHDGHEVAPAAPMIWAYQRRGPDEHPDNQRIKSVIDPMRTLPVDPGDSHHFHYTAGFAVDAEGQMVYGTRLSGRPLRLDRIRINHYWSKSLSEFYERNKYLEAFSGEARYAARADLEEILGRISSVHDDAAVRAVKLAVVQRPGIADYLADEPSGLTRN